MPTAPREGEYWLKSIGKLTASLAGAAVLTLVAAACSSSASSTSNSTTTASTSSCKTGTPAVGVASLPGFSVCLLIPATSKANHPDNVTYAGGKIWIRRENNTAQDGTRHKSRPN